MGMWLGDHIVLTQEGLLVQGQPRRHIQLIQDGCGGGVHVHEGSDPVTGDDC
jgi:hypothetical protein